MSDLEVGEETDVGSVPNSKDMQRFDDEDTSENSGSSSLVAGGMMAVLASSVGGVFGGSGVYEEDEDAGKKVSVDRNVWYREEGPPEGPHRHIKHAMDIYRLDEDEGEDSEKEEEFYRKDRKDKKRQQPKIVRKKAVIMFIHGGGWRRGDRHWKNGLYGNVGRAWANEDFLVCVISYRLTGWLWPHILFVAGILAIFGGALPSGHTEPHLCALIGFLIFIVITGLLAAYFKPYAATQHPKHVMDCADAVAWILNNIQNYGGDPNRIFLAGHDAGGMMAALLALDQRYIVELGIKPSRLRIALRGVIVISAPLDHELLQQSIYHKFLYLYWIFGVPTSTKPDLWSDAFPISHVQEHAPFILLLTAHKEEGNFTQHAKKFAEKLEKHQKNRVKHIIVENTDHTSIIEGVGHGEKDLITKIIMNWMGPLNFSVKVIRDR